MSSLNAALTFKGDLDTISDLPETADFGDVWRVRETDRVYVYTGTDWVCVSSCDTQPSRDSDLAAQVCTPHHDPVAQICTQCNGTLEFDKFGRLHCPYCGTIYR